MKINFKSMLNYIYIRFYKQNEIVNRIKKEKQSFDKHEFLNIAISTNDNFIEQTLIFILSLENACCNIKLHILNINLSDVSINKIRKNCPINVELHIIDVDSNYLDNLKISEKWPMEAWSRILIPELINEDCVLYTDVDCIVVNNIYNLLNYKNNILSGVRSTYYYNDHYIENGINSGIILMNCDELRKFDFFNKVISYAHKHKDELIMPDQDTINAVCSGKIFNIPLKYNVMNFLFANTSHSIENKLNDNYYDKKTYNEALFSPSIIHFNGGPFSRPWVNNKLKHPYYKVYNYYKKRINN